MVRLSNSLAAATLALVVTACGGVFTTASNTDDGGLGGSSGSAGAGTGGRSTGGRAGTGGRSTGGRAGAGGFAGNGGFSGAGGVAGAGGIGPGGFFPTGGFTGAGGAGCSGIDCSYLNDTCHKGTCLGDICSPVNLPDGTPCDDGSLCTAGDTCNAGACVGSSSVGCPQPAIPCQTAVCDPASGACVTGPDLDGIQCDDGNPCTAGDTCKAGTCTGSPVACLSGDGCCPGGCDVTTDSDCGGCTNIALSAVGSSSGGGVPPSRGPDQMNDGVGKSDCNDFHWVFNDSTPSGVYIQLTWQDPVTIGSLYIETESASGASPCGLGNRNLAGGRVQYFSGNLWHDAATITGFTGDVRVDFASPVTTNQLRVVDVTTGSASVYNSVIYEWHVYPQPGCKPPP